METTVPFESFNLYPPLIEALNSAGLCNASPIQEMTINPIIEGKDIFAQAETGSGKTAAFAIPVLEKIIRDNGGKAPSVNNTFFVVLSPTRELAQQTYKIFTILGKPLGIQSTCLIGGEDIEKQIKSLENQAHILIATPGRLLDLTKRKEISFKDCNGIVFDEADRLFDMGFKKDIERILFSFPKNRQLIMVSATSNMELMNTAYKFHSQPLELRINADSLLVDNIDHKLAMLSEKEKMPLLVTLLKSKEDPYALVFCNTQFQTHLVASWLKDMGMKAEPISGRLTQNRRSRLMDDFRSKKITILVCTDVAARGLDIKDVTLVINYDLPCESANYVHRIGRTGRAGKDGKAVSFCAPSDCEYLDGIYEYIGDKIEKMDLVDSDFDVQLTRKPFIDSKTLQVIERTPTRNNRKNSERRGNTVSEQKPRRAKRVESVDSKKRENLGPRIDRRFFKITTYDKKAAELSAMSHLQLANDRLLSTQVIKEGKRKYLLFGSRLTTYKFSIQPVFKLLLTPFLERMIMFMDLDLSVSVSYKNPFVRISFTGKDEKILENNNYEVTEAFEQFIRSYLTQRIVLKGGTRFSIRVGQTNVKSSAMPIKGKRSVLSESKLIAMAKKARESVLKNGKPYFFNSLSPAERRIVHKSLGEFNDVETNSLGEGRIKKLKVTKKS